MFDISQTHPESVSGPWLRHPGNRPVMDLYSLSVTLPALFYTVTILSGRSSQPELFEYQGTTYRQAIRTNQPYLKGNYIVINIKDLTWTLHIKMRSFPVFNRRVGNISAGQVGNSNGQARNCVGQANLILPTHGLLVMKSVII